MPRFVSAEADDPDVIEGQSVFATSRGWAAPSMSRGRSQGGASAADRSPRRDALCLAGLGTGVGECRARLSPCGGARRRARQCRRRRCWSGRSPSCFTPYYDLVDLGYSYRFYAEPPPTPVVTATLQFGDGRPEETVRLPAGRCRARGCGISGSWRWRMRFSWMCRRPRQRTGDASESRLARAYARHLCLTRPGCRSVTLHLQQHLIPELEQVREAIAVAGAPRFDLFAESLFTTPERIGDYPCDGF